MALLDEILKLLGTNRTRMQWKLRAWRRSFDREKAAVQNRTVAQSPGQRVRRLATLVWPADTPVVTTLLVAAILATYAATLVWTKQVGLADRVPFSPHVIALERFGWLSTMDVDGGEWWRLVTSMFLHLDILHIAMNLISLWTVSIFLESELGSAKTFVLYIGLGIIGSVTSYVWNTHTGVGIGFSAGASGAVCGMIGVAIGFSMRRRNGVRELRDQYLRWALWIGILAFSAMRIDNAAHFGGLVPGVALGYVVRRATATGAIARRLWQFGAMACLALTVTSFALAATSSLPDGTVEMARDALDHPELVRDTDDAPDSDDTPAVVAPAASPAKEP